LSDICVAFGLDANRDATKDELLQVVLGAEQQGKFQKPAKDPWRLTKASRSPDEWRSYRDGGGVMPAFEEPDAERTNPNSKKALQQRCKAVGINSFAKGVDEMLAMLAEHEAKAG
jgi:hypothetical protein